MSAPRLDYHALAPKAAKAGTQFSLAAGSTLDKRLRALVDLRISQINGCAFCIDLCKHRQVASSSQPMPSAAYRFDRRRMPAADSSKSVAKRLAAPPTDRLL
jgi:alkylhydroperoxidase family enzyme